MENEKLMDLIEKRLQSSNQSHEEVIRDLQISVNELSSQFKVHTETMKPMVEWFERFNLGKTILMNSFKIVAWLGGAIIAVGGAYVVIQSAFKGFIK